MPIKSPKRSPRAPNPSVEAMKQLQIPADLPVELVRLPIRIRHWCERRKWKTLGALLQNAGGMRTSELLAEGNLGKKSATNLLEFCGALTARRKTALREFLPLAPNTSAVSLAEALKDVFADRDDRDIRIIEMRLVEKSTLQAIADHYDCTRERIRQIEEVFLADVKRVLDWFRDERAALWQAWLSSGNLSSALAEQGVVSRKALIAAAISWIFEETPEGKRWQQRWQEVFRRWSRELIFPGLSSEGIDLARFAKDRGQPELAPRFQFWLETHYGDGLKVTDGRASLSRRGLTAEEEAQIYQGERHKWRWRGLFERLKRYHAAHGDTTVPAKWTQDPRLATWVGNQRARRKKGTMSPEEFGLLEGLGFDWQLRQRRQRVPGTQAANSQRPRKAGTR